MTHRTVNLHDTDDFRRLNQHLEALKSEVFRVGRGFNALSFALQHPQECTFHVDQDSITFTRSHEFGSFGRVERDDFDFDAIVKLLIDCAATMRQMSEL